MGEWDHLEAKLEAWAAIWVLSVVAACLFAVMAVCSCGANVYLLSGV